MRAFPPAGVLLNGDAFLSKESRSLRTIDEVVALIERIKALSVPSPVVMVDLEGGGGRWDYLGRLFGDPFPSPRALAELSSGGIRDITARMAAQARQIGIDLALSPSVDLAWPDRGGKVFAERLFAVEPAEVVRCARAFLDGLRVGGLKSCLKHFPGLGRSAIDPHAAASGIEADESEFYATDLRPFRELCGQADCVMLTHHRYRFLDSEVPASLSRKTVAVLRQDLAFRGLILTDNLTMKALDGSALERAERAIEAGNDLAMLSRGADRSLQVYRGVWERLRELREPRS